MTDARRFPPPWSVEETDACFIVRDHNGQALAWVSVARRSRGEASSLHDLHCHLTVRRGQLRFDLARSVAAARYA